jgi:hypothetical protein
MPYATIDVAKQNTLTIANNLVFCAESFGTSDAYVDMTVIPNTAHSAMDT